MKRFKKHNYFTLLEVVVAIAVLGLGLVGAMLMSSSSKRRIDKAYTNWRAQHLLSQAAEYYLLFNTNADIPQKFFPYNNVRASCEVTECRDLPGNVSSEMREWTLATYNISISGAYQKSVKIDKVIRSSDMPRYELEKINSNN